MSSYVIQAESIQNAYKFKEKIGRGAIGYVFLAHDRPKVPPQNEEVSHTKPYYIASGMDTKGIDEKKDFSPSRITPNSLP